MMKVTILDWKKVTLNSGVVLISNGLSSAIVLTCKVAHNLRTTLDQTIT